MRITKWGECGILCSMHLARRFGDGAVGAADIAQTQGLDLQYTQQILHRLRKGAIVESVRGPRGGYRLSRAPEEISLRDILEAVEGSTFQIICDYAPIHTTSEVSNECSTKESCSLHAVWKELQDTINALLEGKRLSSLLDSADTGVEGLVQLTKRLEAEEIS